MDLLPFRRLAGVAGDPTLRVLVPQADPNAVRASKTVHKTIRRVLERLGVPHAFYVLNPNAESVDKVLRPEDAYSVYHHQCAFRYSNAWCLKPILQAQYFAMDPYGYSGGSLAAVGRKVRQMAEGVDQDAADKFIAERAEALRKGVSKYTQPDSGSVEVPEPGYIFVPLQLHQDTSQKYVAFKQSQLIVSMMNLAVRSDTRVVFKLHPHTDKRTRAGFHRKLSDVACPRISHCPASTGDLIDGARAVVTGNSEVGFEALLLGKPVYCTGTSDYGAATVMVNNPRHLEYLDQLMVSDQADQNWVHRYLYALLVDYGALDRDEAGVEKLLTPLIRHIET